MFNVLLQVLDDGRLTDGQGRTVDFRNTVLVMTSNLGSQAIQALHEEGEPGRVKDAVLGIVGQHFRPEFINRVDDLIVFDPLTRDDIAQIAGLQLKQLNGRLAEQELALALNDDVMARIADQGYDPVYGARPLKRAFQRLIEDPLANAILAGEFPGGGALRAVADGDGVRFTGAGSSDAEAASA